MNLITRDTDYAIRALCHMAQKPEQGLSVTELCSACGLPKAYLRRVLQTLARHGILESHRGKGGGFKLRMTPGKIRLADLIEVFQGGISLTRCVFRMSACTHQKSCPLLGKIKEIEAKAVAELRTTTIASLTSDQQSISPGRKTSKRGSRKA